MSNYDSDSPPDNEWEDRGELAWNEFDWEQYLREQDDMILRYLAFYDKLSGRTDRLDEVAHHMGWDDDEWNSDADYDAPDAVESKPNDATSGAGDFDAEPYTLHKNPIFVSTKAIYLSLKRSWERMAEQPERVPQKLALAFHASLYRAEEQAMLGIQALDFGDYAMAISLFKRALRELNESFALVSNEPQPSRALLSYRDQALPRLFDVREIWLRVMNECRDELERPTEDDDED